MIQTLLQVALGGALGASARYLTGVASVRAFGPQFPWGTMIVNVAGSLVIGALVVALAAKSGERFTPFLMSGLLGGFTTFSAFSLDAMMLWQRGEGVQAGAYVAGSMILSLAGIAAGVTLARAVWP